MLSGCKLLRRDICNSLSGEEEGGHAGRAVLLEHLLSARQLLPREICGCLTGSASDRSWASGCCQVRQEQKVLLISTATSFSSEPDCYLNERLYRALAEMSPRGVCSLLLSEKDAQILFFA